MNTANQIYSRLLKLHSRRETNPDGVIQSREVAELLMAVHGVKLAHAIGVEHNEAFEMALKESLQLRHPFSYFNKKIRRHK